MMLSVRADFMGDYFTAASIAFDKVSPRKSSPFAGWKNLAAMLSSQLAIKLESDTFVEPRYVALDGRKRRSVFRPNEAGCQRSQTRLIEAVACVCTQAEASPKAAQDAPQFRGR